MTKRDQNQKRAPRSEADYVIETPLKVLKVLEALEGRAFEPASIKRIAERASLSQDFSRRALLTLKQAGYAKQTLDGWIIGPKLVRFAGRIRDVHSAISE